MVERLIRLLIALAGGDAQAELPALTREPWIMLQRGPDDTRFVVIAPRRPDGQPRPSGSAVYLVGPVVALRPAPGYAGELQVQVAVDEPPVGVRVPARLGPRLRQVVRGNLVLVQGRLNGNGSVEAALVSVVEPGLIRGEEYGVRYDDEPTTRTTLKPR